MKHTHVKSLVILATIIGIANCALAIQWVGNTSVNPFWDTPSNWANYALAWDTYLNSGSSSADPVLIINGVAASQSGLMLGQNAGHSGYLINEGELDSTGTMNVGYGGYGEFINRGSTVLGRLDIGGGGGNGVFIHESGTLVIGGHSTGNTQLFYFGNGGNAYFRAEADFSISSHLNLALRFCQAPGNDPENPLTSIMEMGASCTGMVNSVAIGFNGVNTDARLMMRGGTLILKPDWNPELQLQPTSTVRGWGEISGGRLTAFKGKVIADAEGEPGRDLDFRNYYSGNFSPPTAGSGWYAVNKGRILFHEFTTTNAYYNAGDREANTALVAANSARIELSGRQEGTIKPFLVAQDHNSVPHIGYKEGSAKAVWHIQTPSFTNARFLVRYDSAAVDDPTRICLLRYDPTAQKWTRVNAAHNPSTYQFDATNLLPQGADNLGFFALVELPLPTFLFLR